MLGTFAPGLPRRLDGAKSEIAREALDHIGALYDIEREIAGKPAAIRLAVRQQLSKPKVEAFRAWAEQQLARIPGKGNLPKSFRYGLSCDSVVLVGDIRRLSGVVAC